MNFGVQLGKNLTATTKTYLKEHPKAWLSSPERLVGIRVVQLGILARLSELRIPPQHSKRTGFKALFEWLIPLGLDEIDLGNVPAPYAIP